MTVKQHAASLVACLAVSNTDLNQDDLHKAIEHIERALRHYEQCPMKKGS